MKILSLLFLVAIVGFYLGKNIFLYWFPNEIFEGFLFFSFIGVVLLMTTFSTWFGKRILRKVLGYAGTGLMDFIIKTHKFKDNINHWNFGTAQFKASIAVMLYFALLCEIFALLQVLFFKFLGII